MDAAGSKKSWPTLGYSDDLTAFGQDLLNRVIELEECWKRGALDVPLSSEDIKRSLGPLLDPYACLTTEPTTEICAAREKWLANALTQFSQVFDPPRARFRSTAAEPNHRHLVEDGSIAISLRSDQVVGVRFWGISIEADDRARHRLLTNMVVRHACERLRSELMCIGRMCRALHLRLIFPDSIRWGGERKGHRFEHLVADILNEDEIRARRASLYEDLFEWTDLRVSYPGLPRKNGARVQVKFTSAKRLDSVPARVNSTTHVLLSPASIGEFIEWIYESDTDLNPPSTFWKDLAAEPADAQELGATLFALFDKAIAQPPSHPLGPLANVPKSIREVLRLYVKHESFEAARRMRDALNGNTSAARSWTRRSL